LCQAFIDVVDARSGAIVVGPTTADRTLLCATELVAARFEDAQDLVHEGPSLDASTSGLVVVSPTEADRRDRWPGLAEVLTGTPTAMVQAIPMRPGAATIGVLTVHHEEGVSPSRSGQEMQFLTDAVGAAILGELPSPDHQGRLWSERDQVSQATGMVIAQLGLDPVDALAVLRAHAYAEGCSVLEVSARIVGRQLDFRIENKGDW
jgi:hypothetical protein